MFYYTFLQLRNTAVCQPERESPIPERSYSLSNFIRNTVVMDLNRQSFVYIKKKRVENLNRSVLGLDDMKEKTLLIIESKKGILLREKI